MQQGFFEAKYERIFEHAFAIEYLHVQEPSLRLRGYPQGIILSIHRGTRLGLTAELPRRLSLTRPPQTIPRYLSCSAAFCSGNFPPRAATARAAVAGVAREAGWAAEAVAKAVEGRRRRKKRVS